MNPLRVKNWRAGLKSACKSQRRQSRAKRRRDLVASECLEPRHLLAGVALTTSPDSYTISFDELETVTVEEFSNSEGQKQLSFRVDGVGNRQVDFDDEQAGVQSILLTDLDRDLIFQSTRDQSTIEFSSLRTDGHDLNVQSVGAIKVLNDAVISTRAVADGSLDPNAVSTASSGEISFSASESISIFGHLLSQVEAGSTMQAGDITLKTSDTSNVTDAGSDELSIWIDGASIQGGAVNITGDKQDRKFGRQVIGVDTNEVDITIRDSTVVGESITVSATANDSIGFYDGKYKLGGTMLTGAVLDAGLGSAVGSSYMSTGVRSVAQWPTISVFQRDASATVTVEGAVLNAQDTIQIESHASSDSELEVIQTKPYGNAGGVELAFGYGSATGSSITHLKPSASRDTQLLAGGDILITSNGVAKAKVNVRTMAPYSSNAIDGATAENSPATIKMGAVAYAKTDLTATTQIDERVSIQSGGDVSVIAVGTPQNIPNASTRAFDDGLAGLTVAYGDDVTNVTATVDGVIEANGTVSVDGESVLPLTASGVSEDTVFYDSSLGWRRGDLLTYEVKGSDENDPSAAEPISGLQHGQQYRIVEVLADALKLAHAMELDLDLPYGGNSSLQSIEILDLKTFDPTSDVTENQFMINEHGFSTGQKVQYLAMVDTATDETTQPEPIGGLFDQTWYYVIPVDNNHFKLASSSADAEDEVAIDLVDQGVGESQGFAYVSGIREFNPVDVLDVSTNTLSIDTAGISSGDRLIYDVDPTQAENAVAARYHSFNTESPPAEVDVASLVTLDQTTLDLVNDLLIFPNHGLSTGDELRYEVGTSAASLAYIDTDNDNTEVSFESGEAWFVIKVDADRIQLAKTMQDAQQSKAVVLQVAAEPGDHVLKHSNVEFVFDPASQVVVETVDVQQDAIFFEQGHRFVTGQRLHYSIGGGPGQSNSAIGGLQDEANQLYAIALSSHELQLANSRESAIAGQAIDLSSRGVGSPVAPHLFTGYGVDTENDWLISPSHRLETGQQVVYEANGGSPVGGLADGSSYYIVVIDSNTVRLADSVEAATQSARDALTGAHISFTSSGSGTLHTLESTTIVRDFDASRQNPVVDLDTNTLALDYDWQTGQKVNYQTSGGDPIGGLEDAEDYYIIKVADAVGRIQLAKTNADALNAVYVDLTSRGSLVSGNHLFRVTPTVELLASDDPSISFDPTATQTVDVNLNTIRISGHGYSTGQALKYLAGNGTVIPGLVNGAEYFVIWQDADHFQLAATKVNANAGTALTIDVGATGDSHGFEIASTYQVNDPPIRGLAAGQTYFAVVDGPNSLRLAPAVWDSALAGVIEFSMVDFQPGVEAQLVAQNSEVGGITVATASNCSPSAAIQCPSNPESGKQTLKNQAIAAVGLGGKPNISDLLSKPELALNSRAWKTAWGSNVNKDLKGPGFGKEFAFAAAAAVTLVDHTMRTTVNGRLETTGDISITSALTQNSKTVGKGSASAGAGKKYSLAIGLAYGSYTNNVVTEIGPGAVIDADGSIEITSDLQYPRLKYPTVKDGAATGGNTSRKNPFNDITVLSKWLGPTSGLDSFLNAWANSVIFKPDNYSKDGADAYDKRAKVAITGSLAAAIYENNTQAIVRSGAKINQSHDASDLPQQVTVEATTDMTVIALAGMMKVNFIKGIMSFNLGSAFSLFGNKAKGLGFGVSDMLVDSTNTTLALIESGALVRTGSAGLKVTVGENLKKNVFAESGSESDGVGIGVSGAESVQTSTNLAQVDAGASVTGGDLTIDANGETQQIVVSGSVVASDAVGIGLSGGVVDLDRSTGAFIGAAPDGWLERYTLQVTDQGSASDGGNEGRVHVTGIEVTANSTGEVYNTSVVGVTPTFRLASNPAGGAVKEGEGGTQSSFRSGEDGVVKDVENKFHINLAGDAAVNVIDDVTESQIDAASFISISALSTTDPANADVLVSSSNDTIFSAASGAAAIASGKRDGSAAAIAGSAAVNIVNQTTRALVTDTSSPIASGQTPKLLRADGDITIQALAGTPFDDGLDGGASVWAVSGSLGYSASGGFTNTGALSASWNQLIGTTLAQADGIDLRSGVSGQANTGSLTIKAVSYHKITGDGGGFAIAREKRSEEGSGAEAMGFGGSYAYNELDYAVTALLSNEVQVQANTLTVSALDNSEITNMTIAGGVEEGASEVALAISAAGSTNQITRKINAKIDRVHEQSGHPFIQGVIELEGDLLVQATDAAEITAVSGGIAFSLDTKLEGAFSGNAGVSWSTNEITEESQVIASIAGVRIADSGGFVTVEATESGSIESWSIQLGVLGSLGEGATVNVAGAIAWNRIYGTVAADLRSATVEHAAGLTIAADSTRTIHSETIDATLSLSLAVANVGVGINVTTNEIGTHLSSTVSDSAISVSGGVNVSATSGIAIDAVSANASLQAAVSADGASVGINYLGIWSTNILRQQVTALIHSSTISESSFVDVIATDGRDNSGEQQGISAKGVGVQVVFTVSDGAAVDVGALTQFSSNDIANSVTASITDSASVNSDGVISVDAEKLTSVESQLYTIAVGFAGSGGVTIDVSAATTVLRNSISDSADGGASRTHAVVDNSHLDAGSVQLRASSTPLIYAKIWDIDIQAAVSGGFGLAAVYGEAKVITDLADDVQAGLVNQSQVNAENNAVSVQAIMDLPAVDAMPEDAPISNVYVDTHSVGVTASISADLVSAAATVLRSKIETNSTSRIIANISESQVTAKEGITVKSDDRTTIFGTLRDTAIAASVVAVAATAPTANQSIKNEVEASIVSSGSQAKTIQTLGSMTSDPLLGDIQVVANATPHLNTEATIWSGTLGIGSASSDSHTSSTLEGTLAAFIDGGNGPELLKVDAIKGNIEVSAIYDGTGETVVHSGAVGLDLVSVDTARPTSTNSPYVSAIVTGKADLAADKYFNLIADAGGHARGESRQTTVSLGFAGGGLTLNTYAKPAVTVAVGDQSTDDELQTSDWRSSLGTKVTGREGVLFSAQSTIDASSEATMNGGSLTVTILAPSSHAEVSPDINVEVGPASMVRSPRGVIEIEAFGGVDQGPRPTEFDANSGIDPEFDTIEFEDLHRLETGDLVRYQNTSPNGGVIAGLEDQREYHVIWFTDKKVQLGEQIDSSLNNVILDQDRLDFGRSASFKGPFSLDQWNPNDWDVITYQQIGDEPIGGLSNGMQYWVNRVDDDQVMLFNYTPGDSPIAPKALSGANVVDSSQLHLPNHGFEDGQAVTYRSQDPVVLSAGVVNVQVASADPPVEDNPDAVDLNPENADSLSHTIYLAEDVERFSDGDVVEYWADAANQQWYWTEGPQPQSAEDDDSDTSSSDLHSLTGSQFWSGDSDGTAISDAYANWDSNQPDNSGGDEHFAVMRHDGTWEDMSGDSAIHAYVIEYPQFILHDESRNWHDARSLAREVGGWLPSISDDGELQRAMTAAAGNTVWLAGSDDKDEDTWIWDGGGDDPNHHVQFWQGGKNGYATGNFEIPWSSDEPNDGSGATAVRNKETVLEMYGSGAWNDDDDGHNNKNRVLVEMPKYAVRSFDSGKTFAEARDDAREQGGWIATIGSDADNETAKQLLQRSGKTSAWIGASDSQIIKGLENHGRYELKISTSPDHRNSVQLYEWTSADGRGDLISIDATGLPSSVNHYLVPVKELPIEGLSSGVTYYVTDSSSDYFSLMKTAEDSEQNRILSNLSGSDATDPQFHVGEGSFIGTMGIDLTDTGEGSHNLRFDIQSKSTGPQTLPLIKLGHRTNPDGTGTASSHVHSAGGSLVAQSIRPQSVTTNEPDVVINLAAGSRLHAAEDIDMTALSAGNGKAKAEAYGGALLAGGSGATVTSVVDHAAHINLHGNLTANGSVTVESKISDQVQTHADAKSYGAIDANALSNATIRESFDSWIDIANGARILAGEKIEINAYSDLVDQMTATTHSGAMFGSSKANQTEGSGIQIKPSGDNLNRTGIAVNDSDLVAGHAVVLHAKMLGVNTSPAHPTDEIVQAFGGGMQNANQATADINVEDTVVVELLDDARITSRDVEILALHENVDLYTKAHTRRGRAASRADANIAYDGMSSVTSTSGATIHADTLMVEARQDIVNGDFVTEAVTDRGSSNQSSSKSLNADREINWNATVLGRGKAELDVDASGFVKTADGIVLNGGAVQEGGRYTAGQSIVVDEVNYDFTEQLSQFYVNDLDAIDGDAKVTGDALFYAQVHADMKNHAPNELELPDIDLANFNIDNSLTEKTFWSGAANGTAVDGHYSNWAAGEPNNYNGSENHVELYSTGVWNDISGDVERGYVLETDRGFELIAGPFTFAEAVQDATSRNGQVASITTAAENNEIWNLSGGGVWINATDEGHEGDWRRPERASVVLVDAPLDELEIRRYPDSDDLVHGRLIVANLGQQENGSTSDSFPIKLNGNIHNPGGLVEIRNLSGDIQARVPGERTVIDAHELIVDAPLGAIHSDSTTNRILARLHQAGQTVPSMSALAQNELVLDIQAQPDDAGRVRGVDRLEGNTVDVGLMAWGESIRQQGPAGYWKLDELPGQSAIEGLGTGMQGSSYGVTAGQSGAIQSQPENKSVRFSGGSSADRIVIDDDARLYGGTTQTVTGWLKVNSFDKPWQSVYWKGDTPDCTPGCANRENTLWLNQNQSLYFTAAPEGSTGEIAHFVTSTIQPGTWYHFASVLDADTDLMKVYINGEEKLSESFPAGAIQNTDGDWHLGNTPAGGTSLNGWLDEFAIFNHVLTSHEIKQQYLVGIASTAEEVDSHYVINGFSGGKHLESRHREIRSQGDLTLRGLGVDGVAAGTDGARVNIEASVEIGDLQDGVLNVTTNGDIWLSEGVDRQIVRYEGAYTFAEAFAEASVNGRRLMTIHDSDEQRLAEVAVDGKSAWFGATDVQQSDQWNWIDGRLIDTTFWVGNNHHGVSVDGRYENWATETGVASEPTLRIAPNNAFRNENYLIMQVDGTWEDVDDVHALPYVLETPYKHELIEGGFSFAEAWLDAYERGGWIATLDTAEEQNRVMSLAAGKTIWLGASDAEVESVWKWIEPAFREKQFWEGNSTGQSVNDAFVNWNTPTGEPNNYGGHEHFGEFEASGGWNDLSKESTRGYLASSEITKLNSQSMRVGNITSLLGDVYLDAPVKLEVAGKIATGPESKFVWNGDGQILHANPDNNSPTIVTEEIYLASIGGLGQQNQALTTTTNMIRGDFPVGAINIENTVDLSLADLIVHDESLLVISEGTITVDGPLRVEGGGNLSLVANGESTVYEYVPNSMTYPEAVEDARHRNGVLATVQTSSEQAQVRNAAGGNTVWFGASDEAAEGDWVWNTLHDGAESFWAAPAHFWTGTATGEVAPGAYANWNTGEPNNYGSGENHAEMIGSGKWNDLHKDNARRYVLEKIDGTLELVNNVYTYENAALNAASRGGRIASIRSQADQDRVASLAQGNSIWINATDENHEGQWYHSSPSEAVDGSFSYWANGQPDDYLDAEDAGQMLPDGRWNDQRGWDWEKTILDQSPAGYWRLNEQSGTTAYAQKSAHLDSGLNGVLEPDDHASGASLLNAGEGVILTAVGSSSQGRSVVSYSSSIKSTGTSGFGINGRNSWISISQLALRADFDSPVNGVKIDFIADDSSDYGILQAYDVNNTLLAEYTTANLSTFAYETMEVNRVQGDIAYILASGLNGQTGGLDNLRYETDPVGTNGAYLGVNLGHAGAMTSVSAKENKSISLVGASPASHVKIHDDVSLYGDMAQSVSGWFKVDSFDKDWQAIYFKGDQGGGATDYSNGGLNRENVLWVNNTGYLHFNISLTGGVQQEALNTPANTVQAGRWYHFATSFDASTAQARIYLDGKLVSEASTSSGTPLRDTDGDWLFGNSPSGQSKFNGAIDDFAIFNHALSAEQIHRQYHAGQSQRLPYVLEYDASLIVRAPVRTTGGDGNINLVGSGSVRIENELQYVDGDVNYTEARQDALDQGGWLAVLHNDTIAEDARQVIDSNSALVGGFDEGDDGNWRWRDSPVVSEEITFWERNQTRNGLVQNWQTGEPNGGTSENIVEVESSGKWNDLSTTAVRSGYLLQLPSVHSQGLGQVVINSGTYYRDEVLTPGTNQSDIWMEDGASVTSESGNLILLSAHDVWLSNLATEPNSEGIGGDVLVVADYDGVTGDRPDNNGVIRDNLSGDLLNIKADGTILSAEGGKNQSSDGIGSREMPLQTKISSLAATTDWGDISIQNRGEMTIDKVDIRLDGLLSEVLDWRDVVPVTQIPVRMSELFNPVDEGLVESAPGHFLMGGVAILDFTSNEQGKHSIDINSDGGLTVAAGVPVINLEAGGVILSALKDRSTASAGGGQLTIRERLFSRGGVTTIQLFEGYEDDPTVVEIPTSTCQLYHSFSTADGVIVEGDSVEVSLSTCNATDGLQAPAGEGENAAGLPVRYFFSTDRQMRNAATYQDGTLQPASSDLLFQSNGRQAVYARVLHADGEFTDYTTFINVENSAPASLWLDSASGTHTHHELTTLTGSFVDAGFNDTHTVLVDWGDGTTESYEVTGDQSGIREFAFNHQYYGSGVYDLYVRISDDAGGFVEEYRTHSLVGIGFRNGALHVIGTTHDDYISIDNKHGSFVVYASFPVNLSYGPMRSGAILASQFRYDIRTRLVDSFVVDLGDGSDRLTSSKDVSIPVTAYGGADNDTLIVSGGPAILFGEDGNDYLQGGPSQDWLDGGDHNDILSSLGGDDYLIGGNGLDELDGGAGDDSADHGDGQDRFVGGLQTKRDMLIVNVSDASLDLARDFSDDLSSFEGIDLRNGFGTTIHVTPKAVSEAKPDHNLVFLRVSDYESVELDPAWNLVNASFLDGVYARTFEAGEAKLQIAGPIDSTNPINPLDVNGDQQQTAVDALQIINEIARANLGPAEGEGEHFDAVVSQQWHSPAFLDVNSDQQVTLLDALHVLNGLRVLALEAEGEAANPVQIQEKLKQSYHNTDLQSGSLISSSIDHETKRDRDRDDEELANVPDLDEFSPKPENIVSESNMLSKSAIDSDRAGDLWQSEVEEFFTDYAASDSRLVVDLFGDRE